MTGSNHFVPNPAQEAAIAHGDGPLRIIAGAGSGKTTTLARRIARLIEDGRCRPAQVLMLTFTTKAAAEMRHKVAARLPEGSEQPRIETYHAFALSLVEEFAGQLGFPAEPILLTEGPIKLFLKRHFDRLGVGRLDLRQLDSAVSKALGFFEWHRHEATYLQEPAALLDMLNPEDEARPLVAELLTAHDAYRALLREHGAADYGDLIALVAQLLAEHPEVLAEVRSRYAYVLVDEYQDTDHLQGRFIEMLAGGHGNITVVGDPDQAIYGFRGATLSNLFEFEQVFTGVKHVPMVTNYRSVPGIVAVANAAIAGNVQRKAEALEAARGAREQVRPLLVSAPDFPTEAEWIAGEMLRLHGAGVAWSDMVILVRAGKHKLPLYTALVDAKVPVQIVGGLDLFQDAETARLLCFLRAVADPQSDADLSVALGLPRYGLTDADIAWLARSRQRGERLTDAVERESAGRPALSAFLDEFWPLYRQQFTEGFEATVRSALALHRSSLSLQARLNGEHLLPLAESLARTASLVAREGLSPLGVFCEYLDALRDVGEPPEGVEIDDSTDAVRIMTVHTAKGLEFPVVFLPRLTERDFHPAGRKWDRLFPLAWHHDAAMRENPEQVTLEEERRLFYVAVTRAKDRLYLSWAPVDPDRKRPMGPSGFVGEVEAWCEGLSLAGAAERGAFDEEGAHAGSGAAVGGGAAAGAAEAKAVGRAWAGAGANADVAAAVADQLQSLVSSRPAKPLALAPAVKGAVPKVPAVLSFSHLSTYQACPFRFYLQYLLGLPGRPVRAADAGVRIHAAIEKLGGAQASGQAVEFSQFQAWAAAAPLPDGGDPFEPERDLGEEQFESSTWEATPGAQASTAPGAATPPAAEASTAPGGATPPAAEAGALANFWASEFGRTPPLASEQEFFVSLGGSVVRGFIDRIHRRPDGSVEVVDFKTYNRALTEQKARDSLQIPIYLKAAREALGYQGADTGVFYFLKQDKTVRVRYTDAELQQRWEEAAQLITAARSGNFAPKPNEQCGFCPYCETCPAPTM